MAFLNSYARRLVLPVMIIVAILIAAALPLFATTLEEEVDLGKKIDDQILKQYPQITDKQALEQINEYGQNLKKGVQRPEIEYHFRILKDDDLNAFSTPGGYVYFTDHLWNVLRKDERIGVLAHEIVHTDRRHALDAISKQQRRQLWLTAILTVIGANQTWGDIAGLAESLYTLKYSRGDEQQADEIGVQLTKQAGYNPAGLLLAMRKIKRFQDESGGEQPKIFSSHPPTDERLRYIESLLVKMNVPIPPENIQDQARSDRVGTVTAVSGNSVDFAASKPVKNGDLVWVMGNGWDYYYEKQTPVPVARAIVRATGDPSKAEIWPLSAAKQSDIKAGVGIYAPPLPEMEPGVARIRYVSHDADAVGRLATTSRLVVFDRMLARQIVWNKDNSRLVVDNVGYVVITDPSSDTGYLAVTRPKFAYAPVGADSTLVRLQDPEQDRWVSPVFSIGRRGQTIEARPTKALDPNKTYEVAYPAWNSDDSYSQRVVGTAKLRSSDGKVVLQMTGFTPGWTMNDIREGFDIYLEAAKTDPAK